MESWEDLLRLPVPRDLLLDQHFQKWTMRPRQDFDRVIDRRRRHEYWMIDITRRDLDAVEERLSTSGDDPALQSKAKKYRGRLRYLEAGWESIAKTLYQESLRLFRLPREIRDLIYFYVYRHACPITVKCMITDVERKLMPLRQNAETRDYEFVEYSPVQLPVDRPGYLNRRLVHPQIAREAAEVFYKTNVFFFAASAISLQKYLKAMAIALPVFLLKDHYNSGVLPIEAVRDVVVVTQRWGFDIQYKSVSEYRRFADDVLSFVSGSFERCRPAVAPLLAATRLQRCTILFSRPMHGRFAFNRCYHLITYHQISSIILELRERGVDVRTWWVDWCRCKHASGLTRLHPPRVEGQLRPTHDDEWSFEVPFFVNQSAVTERYYGEKDREEMAEICRESLWSNYQKDKAQRGPNHEAEMRQQMEAVKQQYGHTTIPLSKVT